MSVKPIRPGEVAETKIAVFPDEVLEAFNEIIAANYANCRSSFTVADVVKLMIAKGLNRMEVFNNNWLDIEEIYEEVGWDVVYDQPGYNESYAANFTFTAKRKPPR